MTDLAEAERIVAADNARTAELRAASDHARADLAAAEAAFEAAVTSADRRAARLAAEAVADAEDAADLSGDALRVHVAESTWRTRHLLDARLAAANARWHTATRALEAAKAEAADSEIDKARAEGAWFGIDERIERAQADVRAHRAAIEARRAERVATIRRTA